MKLDISIYSMILECSLVAKNNIQKFGKIVFLDIILSILVNILL